jgi:hypothetical protein
MFGCRSRCSRELLLSHLRQRQSRAHGNHIEDGVLGIRGQAQPVKLLPGANADIGRIGV